jgi:acetylornithine/succinyldiaminopimelate/putrescine aminotransferase
MGFYEKDKEYVLNTYKRIPVEIVRGEGGYVWDVNGKKYLDFFSGIAVLHLGHNNKELNDKVKAQIDKYMHLSIILQVSLLLNLQKNWLKIALQRRYFLQILELSLPKGL